MTISTESGETENTAGNGEINELKTCELSTKKCRRQKSVEG